MSKDGNVRFEVTIGADVAHKLRRLAYERKMELWLAVEKAVELLEADAGNTAR